MKPSRTLLLKGEAISDVARRFHVANPRVVGSVLHGTDKEGSDLDVLVDPLLETTLFDLGGLQAALEDVLGVRVDVVTPGDLPARFREEVIAEASPI